MPDRSDEFRTAAAECLRFARSMSDESARASLLVMAQKWLDLANGSPRRSVFDAALRAFNEGQMSPKPVTQQQQQIQPKEPRVKSTRGSKT